jgi:hypothetical protein
MPCCTPATKHAIVASSGGLRREREIQRGKHGGEDKNLTNCPAETKRRLSYPTNGEHIIVVGIPTAGRKCVRIDPGDDPRIPVKSTNWVAPPVEHQWEFTAPAAAQSGPQRRGSRSVPWWE